MFRQIYSFDGANEASKRTKINNVRYGIPHTNNSFTEEFYIELEIDIKQ